MGGKLAAASPEIVPHPSGRVGGKTAAIPIDTWQRSKLKVRRVCGPLSNGRPRKTKEPRHGRVNVSLPSHFRD